MARTLEGGSAGGAMQDLARLAHWWRTSVSEPVFAVLFPPRCVGCGDFESHLCPACREAMEAIGADSCPRCGEPGPVSLVAGRCARCMGREITYAGARGAFFHRGVARRLVADFKFGAQPVLGRVMADVARPAFTEYVSSIAPADEVLVTWVPCHRAAQRKRGYNQAEVLARALASGRRPTLCAGIVRKTMPTKHQKGLGRAGRQGNLRGAFALDAVLVSRVPSRTQALVLVDDVYTTGATAKEVASVLSAGTGLPVYVFTFSRAVSSATERHD
jgi:predicted amidophosphoribosyltransferase